MDTSEAELELHNSQPRSFACWLLFSVLLVGLIALACLLLDEFQSSRLQARYFSRVAQEATFHVKPGPSNSIRFPHGNGPYDQRLGYAHMLQYLQRLQNRNYVISAQAVQSDGMIRLADNGLLPPLVPLGLFLPYQEKDQGGLTLYDSYDQPIYQARYPQRVYQDFAAIPPLLVTQLLYIENNTLLDGSSMRNPAIEWSRFSKAIVDKSINILDPGYRAAGASTLATQIEKYRHSPKGRTGTEKEKLRQMLSASVRAYRTGENTMATRQKLVVAYINTVPLAARAGFGEVSGIGDGMWAWYGRSFEQINQILQDTSSTLTAERAVVFKEALSLMISQRSPSYFLNGDMQQLESLTNAYLRLMTKDGVISAKMRDAALKVSLQQQKARVRLPVVAPTKQKGANAIRVKLGSLLGVSRMYDLDHLDLSVNSTLDSRLQQEVTSELIRLRDPAYAKSVGLSDENLLQKGSPQGVTYSFTLLESTPEGNKVRVQADNFDQPFDINEGAKLDLGSTAKLRTLITYLSVIHELHQHYSDMSADELEKINPGKRESLLQRWVIDYLKQTSDRSLAPMLAASLERTYSASPEENFFTGGGLHTFNNFDKDDDSRTLSVREATQRSVNLVYIRLMRDIVRYYMQPVSTKPVQEGDEEAMRQQYLRRFADREGKTFLAGFYNKYRHKSRDETESLVVKPARQSAKRLAVIFRSIEPDADMAQFTAFMNKHLNAAKKPDQKSMAKLYADFGSDRFNLTDRGYLAGMHPLELWLVGHQRAHPSASWSELVRASADQRQEVYQWLFNSRHKEGQTSRINEMKEAEAFDLILKTWKQLGYPFDALVPSYASALGASADRPAALAELMGILTNDGMREPTIYIEKLHFAANTPYETSLTQKQLKGARVLPPEIPQLIRSVLQEVVERGTARRVSGAFDLANGEHIAVGGKTGTGDNRFKVFAKGGVLTSERVVSRSGTFAFYIGERYFGTMVAYVDGPKAANYKFTSALPAQILKVLAPTLKRRLSLAPSPDRAPVINTARMPDTRAD